MKKLILTGLSFLFAITLTFAQEITPETKAKETVTVLTEKLTLNDDQQKLVYDIILENNKANVALSTDTTLTAETLKEQISNLKTAAESKIAEVLTEDQKATFLKYLEELKAKEEEKVES